jgi:muramoyltetrapeptide carboxypeptidase
MPPIIKPKALGRGDAIGVVAPAGPVNRERMERAIARVEARGFRLKTYGDIYRSHGYLAGDDATRASEFMEAFGDAETSAVWCARGGYGVARILDKIDFSVVRRNPKAFVGFSDITLLHSAIQQQTGLITFHGPNLQDGFGKPEEMPAANAAALWRAVMGPTIDAPAPGPPAGKGGYTFDFGGIDPRVELLTMSGGVVSGGLMGGNLAVISGLIGTRHAIEPSGCILLLEDISERVYRIDRYLSQLRMSGKLAQVAGVLLGDFSYDDDEPAEEESAVLAVLAEYLIPLGVPILARFPAGHRRYNLALPIGGLVELDANAGRVTVLEDSVEAG